MPLAAVSTTHSTDWEGQQLTHMPFLCHDGARFFLVFARSLYVPRRVPQYSRSGTTRIWRLAWAEFDPRTGRCGTVKPLRTGLAGNEVECSPCVSFHAGEAHVSFIGTAHHGTGPLEHRLFRMSGPSLDQLSSAVYVSPDECFSGFWRPDQTAFSSGRDGEIRMRGSVNAQLRTGFQEVARVSFMDEDPQRLLITGVLPGETVMFVGQPQPHTIAYDLAQNAVLGEVLVAGTPSYKPSIAKGWVAHVHPHFSPRRESWKVALNNQVTLAPTSIMVTQIK